MTSYLKFDSNSPNNSEIGRSLGKSESSIRAFKKTKSKEEINELIYSYKESNYPFVEIEEYISNNYKELNDEEILSKSKEYKDLIDNGLITGAAYTNKNSVKKHFLPPFIHSINETTEMLKELDGEKEKKEARVIAIGNHKGGANKTTHTLNLCSSLALMGKRCLIVDFDVQGNASSAFGIYEGEYTHTSIDLIEQSADENIEEIVKKSIKNVNFQDKFENKILGEIHIMPNNASMMEKAEDLPTMSRNLGTMENTLKTILSYIKEDYDFIIIDLPPRTDLIFRMAMIASDYFVIALSPQPFAKLGMPNILNPINKFRHIYKKENNKNFHVLGGLVGFYEKGVITQDLIYDQMKKDLEDNLNNTCTVFDSFIPKSSIVQNSQLGAGAVLFDNPSHKIVRNYFDATLDILTKICEIEWSEKL